MQRRGLNETERQRKAGLFVAMLLIVAGGQRLVLSSGSAVCLCRASVVTVVHFRPYM